MRRKKVKEWKARLKKLKESRKKKRRRSVHKCGRKTLADPLDRLYKSRLLCTNNGSRYHLYKQQHGGKSSCTIRCIDDLCLSTHHVMFRLGTFQNFLQSESLSLGNGWAIPNRNQIVHSKSYSANLSECSADNVTQTYCYFHRESSTFCSVLFAGRISEQKCWGDQEKNTYFPRQLVNYHARDSNCCCFVHAPRSGDNAPKGHWWHLECGSTVGTKYSPWSSTMDFTEIYRQSSFLVDFSPGAHFILTAAGDRVIVRRTDTFQITRTWVVDPMRNPTQVVLTSNKASTTRHTKSHPGTSSESGNSITHIGWSCDSEYILAASAKQGIVYLLKLRDEDWHGRIDAGTEGDMRLFDRTLSFTESMSGLLSAEWAPDGRTVVCFSEWGVSAS